MNQSEFIHGYNDKYRPKFNPLLFERNDDELINAIRNVIYSCERDLAFTIKVLDFTVIDNYDDINYAMWQYEDSIINKVKKDKNGEEVKTKKSSSKSKKDNIYSFINLDDSDIKLIKVTYFIQITEKKDGLVNSTLTVYIAVPRLIDKFYFRINGNYHSAMYQIVDASTYNNTASKRKEQIVTLKTMFSPIRLYRHSISIKDITGESVPCTYFMSAIFSKSLLIMKYLLAKMGFDGAKEFLGFKDVNIVKSTAYTSTKDYYIFPVRDMYVTVPKPIYDNIQIVQSFVYTVLVVINYMKSEPYENIKDINVWLKALGAEFTNTDNPMMASTIIEKGKSILSSLEFVYDKITQKDLKLCEDDKRDIYCVLRWMMYEFNALRQKDNLDVSTKKVRWAEYLAAMYAMKLFRGICQISDKGANADLNTIRKAIQIQPMYLINNMMRSKCQLVNYKACNNDMDSLIALKYTYKGLSGIGEKSNSISQAYRNIHPSHLGRVDIDSSSNSDPGVSGTICPLTELHDGHFDNYEEPSTWREDLAKVIDKFRSMESKKDMVRLISDHRLNNQNIDQSINDECISINKSLVNYSIAVSKSLDEVNLCDVFNDGIITVTYE